jgi:hypothetical protein
VKLARTLGFAALALTLAACAGNDRDRYIPSADELARFERVTTFDGRVLEVDLPRGDGTRDRFDAVRDEWYGWSYVPARLGYAGRRWTLGKTTATHTSMVYAVVSWNDDNPTDYLAAGWWLRFPGRYSFRRGLSLEDAESAAFVDGPELDMSDPPRLPDGGTATYAGGAGGFYRYRDGSAGTGADALVHVEEFSGTMVITADFSDNTLRGCLGCVGDLVLEREHLYAILRRRPGELTALPTDYELHFGVTDLTSRGTFVGTDVTVVHPERRVTESSGYWDGRLSNQPDADGNPRLVAGKSDVQFVEDDGSEGQFRSLYTAVGESLLPPDTSPDR